MLGIWYSVYYFARLEYVSRKKNNTRHTHTNIYVYMIILFSGDPVRILFSSRPQIAILGTGILDQVASFDRRLRGAAPTPLALLYPFRTST